MSWFYAQNGQQRGPIELAELQGLLAGGQLTGHDLVWTEGMPQWQPAASVPTVMPATAMPAPPSAPLPQSPAIPAAPYVASYQSAYSPYEQPSKHAGLALTSMILSLLSLALGGPFLSIPGAICGHIALKGMRQTGDLRNQGFAQAGFWVGLILSLFWGLILLIIIVIFIVAAVGAASGH